MTAELETAAGHWRGQTRWRSRGDDQPQDLLPPALEAVIGHPKAEHRLGRNHLTGRNGDRGNAVLAVAGGTVALPLRALFEAAPARSVLRSNHLKTDDQRFASRSSFAEHPLVAVLSADRCQIIQATSKQHERPKAEWDQVSALRQNGRNDKIPSSSVLAMVALPLSACFRARLVWEAGRGRDDDDARLADGSPARLPESHSMGQPLLPGQKCRTGEGLNRTLISISEQDGSCIFVAWRGGGVRLTGSAPGEFG